MFVAHEAANDVRSHASQADHAKLHVSSPWL
jgi:hypothetical protein